MTIQYLSSGERNHPTSVLSKSSRSTVPLLQFDPKGCEDPLRNTFVRFLTLENGGCCENARVVRGEEGRHLEFRISHFAMGATGRWDALFLTGEKWSFVPQLRRMWFRNSGKGGKMLRIRTPSLVPDPR